MPAFRDSVRRIQREPRLPIVMVVVLAVALGACGAVFSILNALLLEPLPYPHHERLVALSAGARVWSVPMFDAFLDANSTFDRVAGLHERAIALAGDGSAEMLRLEAVSASYFEMLGVAPIAGRTWSDADDRSPAGVGLISDALWQRRFAADPTAVGRTVKLDGTSVRIVGVLPRGFHGLIGRTDVWVPLRFADWLGASTPPGPARPWSRWFEVVARVKPGLTLQTAAASADVDLRRAMAALPGADRALGPRWRPAMTTLADVRRDPRQARAAGVLSAAVLFVLLLAAANLAGLHAVRSSARLRDLAVQAAIGATRGRIAALLLTEIAIVTTAGIAASIPVRHWFLAALLAMRPEPTTFGLRSADLLDPRATDIGVGGALAVIGAAVLCAVAIAARPLTRAMRPRLEMLLRQGHHARAGLGPRSMSGNILVAVEIALAVVVISGAALMGRTALNLWTQDRAFDPDDVLTLRIQVVDARYPREALPGLYDDLVRRIEALPGVDAASVSNCAPGAGRCRQTNVRSVDGRELAGPASPTVGVHYVTPGHFSLLHTHVLDGRAFGAADSTGAVRSVIVNESTARRLWPGQSAVGHRLALHFANGANTEERQVVGVVANVQFDATEETPGADVYVPAAQMAWSSAVLFARSRMGDDALRREIEAAVGAMDPDLPLYDVRRLADRLGAGFAIQRFLATTLAAFALAALFLAVVGEYGLVSYAASESRRELAIRSALGATRRRLIGLLLGRAALAVGCGLAAGAAGAVAGSRALSGFLYGVQPRDSITLAGVVILFAIVSACAVVVPARRGASVAPAEVLRGN